MNRNKQINNNNQTIVVVTIFVILIGAAAAWNAGIVNIEDPIGFSMTKSPTWKIPIVPTETVTPTFLASTGWWKEFPTPLPAYYTATPTITQTPTKTLIPTRDKKKITIWPTRTKPAE